MSMLSTLALMVAAGARAKPDPRDHEIIGLKVDLADARRDLAQARLERAQAQYERDIWRDRAVSQVLNYRPPQQQAQATLAQQAFINAEMCFCNCVPSRAQVWWAAQGAGGVCGGGGGGGA